jgi:photosystem II stability/assembly factor-like uncharacterized protein
MSHERIASARRFVALLALIATLPVVRAGAAPVGDWEQLGPPDRGIARLFTPVSGALFARSSTFAGAIPSERGIRTLLRSDDAGETWRELALPPRPVGGLTVDPTDHTVLYAYGAEGIYKSDDDAASWRLVHPVGGYEEADIAVSPADHQIVYVLLTSYELVASQRLGSYRLLRSRDGGLSWDQLDERRADGPGRGCSGGFGPRLTPHPTDGARLFGWIACYELPLRMAGLNESVDQGASWSPVFGPGPIVATGLVGGSGVVPSRFYMVGDDLEGGYSLNVFRSDDDGKTWRRTGDLCCRPATHYGAIAYDPAAPDRVYVGPNDLRSGAMVSEDGGETWGDLAGPLPAISDLALGIDGRFLFAAAGGGIYRLRLR